MKVKVYTLVHVEAGVVGSVALLPTSTADWYAQLAEKVGFQFEEGDEYSVCLQILDVIA